MMIVMIFVVFVIEGKVFGVFVIGEDFVFWEGIMRKLEMWGLFFDFGEVVLKGFLEVFRYVFSFFLIVMI